MNFGLSPDFSVQAQWKAKSKVKVTHCTSYSHSIATVYSLEQHFSVSEEAVKRNFKLQYQQFVSRGYASIPWWHALVAYSALQTT